MRSPNTRAMAHWRAISSPKRVEPVHLHREPHLEGAKAARELGPEVGEPRLAAGGAALGAHQVRRFVGEGRPVQRAVAHEHDPRIVRDVQPLVEVESQRVGALDPIDAMAQRRREPRQGPEGAVDVEPQAFVARAIGDRGQVVDRTGARAARRGDDRERRRARRAVGRDRRPQRSHVHPQTLVDRDRAQRIAAQTGQLEGSAHRSVRLARRIRDERRGAAQTAAANAFAQCALPRHQERDEVAHRGSGGDDAAGLGRKFEDLQPPPDHAALDLDRRVIAAAEVRVLRRREQLGQHTDGGPGAVHPAEEARVAVVDRVRLDVIEKREVDVGRIARRARQRIANDRLTDVERDRSPGRALADVAQRLDRVIDGPVRDHSKGFPFVGIERTIHNRNLRAIATSSLNVCCGRIAST